MTRRQLRVLVVVGLVVVGALAIGIHLLRSRQEVRGAFPRLRGELTVRGPEAPLALLRDRRGIPHVEAENDRDAFFGLGFAHAQDRLAQMEWLRRVARGRLAEVLGSDSREADLFARTVGFGRHGDAQAERLPAATRRELQAYAAGVNARIARIRRGEVAPPLALQRLQIEADPWTPGDTIALVKALAWGLSASVEESLAFQDLIRHLGAGRARFFLPPGSQSGTTGPERSARLQPGGFRDPIRRLLGLSGQGVGSSAWVVSGAVSASSHPLLAADSHLEVIAPALFYEAHLRGRHLDAAGATLPGVPILWTGHNRTVAWASTHAGAVVTDLFVETLHPSDPTRYGDRATFRALATRAETVAVRGSDPQVVEVRETHRGPLLNPVLESEREPLALRWPGALPGDSVTAFLRVARAESGAALRKALARHHEPVLAVVFADSEGDAGVQVAGFLPRRSQPTGGVPVAARGRSFDWEGRIPADRLPRRSLGGDRTLVVADNALPEPTGGERIEWLWRTGARAARIEALLRDAVAHGSVDLRDLAALQADVRSNRAPGVIALALSALGETAPPEDEEGRAVHRMLGAWDGETRADSVGAAVAHVFLDRLLRELFTPVLSEALLDRYLALRRVEPLDALRRALEDGLAEAEEGDGLFDRTTVVEAVRKGLRDTWIWLTVQLGPNKDKWSWGRLHRLHFRGGWPGEIGDDEEELGPFAYDGDASTVAVAEYDPADPFGVRVASTYRFVCDTGSLDQVLSSLVPGQSEHLGHPHRRDGMAGWLAGRPRLLFTGRILIDEHVVSTLRLLPANEGAAP